MDSSAEKPPVPEPINHEDDSQTAVGEVSTEREGSFKDYIRVFHYCDKYDWALNGVSLLCSIAAGAAMPLMTVVFGQFTNTFNGFATGDMNPEDFRNEVDSFVLWFIYLFIARFVVIYVSTGCINIAAIRTTRALRQAFLESTLRQEIWHFDNKSNGAVATQVTTNGNRIHTGIAEKLTFTVQALSMFFASFVVALVTQWKLALITMSVIPAIFIITGVCIGIDAVQEARIVKIYSRAANLAEEVLSSIRTVHAFYAQEKMLKKYDEYLEQAHQEGKKKSPNYGVLFSTEYFCVYSAIALSFWQGYRMYQSGEITDVGQVFTVVLSVTIAATAISTFAPQLQSLTNAASAASELFTIIDKPSKLDPLDPSGARPETCNGDIEVKNLNFSYPSRPTAQVLRNFSITIPAGKTTALVGASGSGKSTLVGLLERWYVPNSGDIIVDGIKLSDYNTAWIRSRIRLVQQEPVLFRGTVFENVARGFVDEQLQLSREEQMTLVREACEAANADDFVNDLPDGYDTQVGERAGRLSGGQKQRIAIARSIVSNPKILLLDEATSALDPRAEKVVQDALNRVSENRTTLIIAHKLSTVKSADNIAVMHHGNIVEQGTHQELIDRNGHYASLVRAQDLGHEAGNENEDGMEQAKIRENQELADLQLEKSLTAVSTTPGDVEKQKPEAGTLGYSLIRCIAIMFYEQKDLYFWFFISTIACLIGGATFPAQAILFSRLLTIFELTGQDARDRADFFSLMFFIVALGNLVAYFAMGWTCNVIGQTVTHRYRAEMLQRVMNQDIEFFDNPENTSGALTSKLSVLPTDLQELISANVLLIFIVLVNLVSSSILALAYGWKLGLVVIFGALPPLILAGYLRIRLETRLGKSNSESFSESASLASEAVSAIRTVSSLTLERQILKEYNNTLSGIVLRSTRALLLTMFWFSLSQSMDFLAMALGFWYGSRLLSTFEYTTEQFYIIFIGVLFAGQAAGQFFSYSTSLTKAQSAANYILWLRTTTPTIKETPENKTIGPKDGPISLDKIEFRYRQRSSARVIRGVSMTVEPGKFVAFVGASGCGKSTLIALVERFYDPTSGTLCVNNEDIKTMTPRLYRAHMSLVQQEPTLYQGSVRENVSLGLEYEPTQEEINEACRKANAFDFVTSLPEGFETPCGGRGQQFSGGQRQRIAIARALIRNPKVLLLDEATSALDTRSERIVQAALDEASISRTTVAVAHRLSTIRNADIIYVFSSGKIVEMGTHAELQRLRGRYYEMCLAQSLDQA